MNMEIPIYGAIYWDGKEFRGYVPESGNVYNTMTKECFGNSEGCPDSIEELDGYNILKQLKIKHKLKNIQSFESLFEEVKFSIESSSALAMQAIEDRLELCLLEGQEIQEF